MEARGGAEPNMEERIAVLERVPLFGGFSREELETLAGKAISADVRINPDLSHLTWIEF
jgi:hypothetical protein